MKEIKYFVLLFLLAGAVFTSLNCSTAKGYFSDDNIPVGGETSIKLDVDKAGGYEWEIGQNSDPLVLTMQSNNFVAEQNGQGKQVFIFKGKKKGTVEITFNYINKQLSSGKVFKTKKFSVTVR